MLSKGSRILPWLIRTYPYQFLIFLTFLIIFGVTFRIAYFHYEDAVNNAMNRNRSIASLTARIIFGSLKEETGRIQSYASRPLVIKAARNKDSQEMIRHLALLKNDDPEIDMVFVTDPNGMVWANFPVSKETHGRDFSQSHWYKYASKERKSFVSNLYQEMEGKDNPGIVVCTPIFDGDEVLGILAAYHPLALICDFADAFIWYPEVKFFLFDRAGQIICSNRYDAEKKIIHYPLSPLVNKAMEEGKGDLTVEDPSEGGEVKYLALEPIKGIGWLLLVEKAKKEIINSVIGRIVEYSVIALLLLVVFVLSLGYFRKVLVSRQLAERKQAQEELYGSEKRFRELFDEAPVGYHSLDVQGRIIRVNETELKMLGYTAEEMLGQFIWDFMENKEERRQVFTGKITGTVPPGRGFEQTFRRKDGVLLPVLVGDRIFRDHEGKITGLRSTIQDISERKRAEEALREREREAQRVAQENAIVAEIGRIISLTLSIEEVYARFAKEVGKLIPFDRIAISVINYGNNTFTIPYNAGLEIPGRRTGNVIPLGGTTTEEVVRTRCGLLVREEDREELMSRIPGVLFLFQEGFRSLMSIPLISKDQVIGALVLQSIKPDDYTERDLGLAMRVGIQIAGVIANAQLFLERKQAEEVMREAEERFRLLFEISTNGVLIRDQEGIIRLANPMAVKMLKASRLDEMIGKAYLDFVHPEDRPESMDRIQRSITALQGEPGIDAADMVAPLLREHRLLTLDGESVYVESTGTCFRHQGQVWIQGIFHDINKRKQAEEALRKSEEVARRMAKENAIVAEIGRIISSTLDIENIYERFAEQARELIPFDHIAITTIDREKGMLHVAYVSGYVVPGRGRMEVVSLAGSLSEEAARGRSIQLIQTEDAEELAARFPKLLAFWQHGFRSFMAVPLISNDQVVGVLCLYSIRSKAYKEADANLAEQIAAQIAGAIANAQLYAERKRAEEALGKREEEARKLANENAIVAKIGRIISSSFSMEEVYRLFTEELKNLLSFDRIAINIIDAEKNSLVDLYVEGIPVPGRETGEIFPLRGTLTEAVIQAEKGLFIGFEDEDEVAAKFPGILSVFAVGLRSFLSVPLISRHQVVGALHLVSRKYKAYAEEDLRLAECVANQIAGAVANAQLFLECRQAEAELEKLTRQKELILNSAGEGILGLDLNGNHTFVNPSAARMLGYEVQELVGQTSHPIWHNKREEGSPYPQGECPIHASLRDGSTHYITGEVFWKKDGTSFPVDYTSTPIREDGKLIGAVITFRDITDRRRAEEALGEREEEARKLANENAIVAKIGRIISSTFSIEDVYKLFTEEVKRLLSFDRIAINLIDPEKKSLVNPHVDGIPVPGREEGDVYPLRGTFTEAVIQAEKGLIIGFEDEDELRGKFPGLLPEFRIGLRSFLSVPLISGNQVVGALHLVSRKNRAYAKEDLRLAEGVANQIAGAVANAQLFLERKRAEEQLKASLKEKEILLREIHHRVKNNLQVISSLLRLQSRYIGDDAISRYFKESQDRVRTMAIIHEKLYQSIDLARVDFAEYIKDLTANLYRSYGVDRETIGLRVHVNNLFLDIDMANPCGLIINELVSNSLKYAFPGGERGEIFIDLRSDHDQIILTVGDNGGAFPKGLDFRKTESLGLQLVISLVEQLEGTIELHRDGKTEFRIAFPARHPM